MRINAFFCWIYTSLSHPLQLKKSDATQLSPSNAQEGLPSVYPFSTCAMELLTVQTVTTKTLASAQQVSWRKSYCRGPNIHKRQMYHLSSHLGQIHRHSNPECKAFPFTFPLTFPFTRLSTRIPFHMFPFIDAIGRNFNLLQFIFLPPPHSFTLPMCNNNSITNTH